MNDICLGQSVRLDNAGTHALKKTPIHNQLDDHTAMHTACMSIIGDNRLPG